MSFPDPDPFPDVAAVLRAVERRFRVYGPSVDAAMSVFVPVLEDRDAKIARLDAECDRLREVIADYLVTGERRDPLDHLTPSPAYGARLLETVRTQGSHCKSLEGNPILSIYSKVLGAAAVVTLTGGLALAAGVTPASAASTPLPAYPATTTLNLGSPNCVTDDVIMNDPLDSTSPITDTYGSAGNPLANSQATPPVKYYLWYLNNANTWTSASPPGTQINPTTGVISAYGNGAAAISGDLPATMPSGTGSVTYTVRDHGKDAVGAVGTEQFQLTVNETTTATTVSYGGNTFNNANGALTIQLNGGSTTSTALTLSAIASSLNIPDVGGQGSTPVTFALVNTTSGWHLSGGSTTAVLTGVSASDPEFTATTPDHDVVYFTLKGISTTSGGVFYTNTDANPCVTGAPAPAPIPTSTGTTPPVPVSGVVGEISSFADYSYSCLDNAGFRWADGNPIQLWKCGAAGGADQQFTLATVNGHQVLEAVAPAGKPQGPWCVTDNGRGAQLTISSCTGGASQQIGKYGPYYEFADGNVMNDAGWYTGNGAGVIAWQMVGTRNERWSLP